MILNNISRPWRFRDTIVEVCIDIVDGDVSKQNYSVVGITKHVGVKIKCRKCNGEFYFTAKEQAHWYETLKFWVDSVPVDCVKCRGVTREITLLNKRLSKILSVNKMGIDDYNEIVDVVVCLLGNGVKCGGRLGQKARMAAKRSGHSSKDYLLKNVNAI